MTCENLEERLREAIDKLPTETGGLAIVLATAGSPPAMAVLSSGDIHMSGQIVRVGVHGSSSAATRLRDSFTILVPLDEIAVRIEVGSAKVVFSPPLARLEGKVVAIRPTAEPPWVLEMGFAPHPGDHPSVLDYVDYWRQVKAWLAEEHADPPALPA